MRSPSDGLIIESFHSFGPQVQGFIVGILLFQLMDIPEEVDPTALMQALMDVVAAVEVTAEHALKVTAEQLLDDLSCTGMMVLLIANSGRGNRPDVAIDPVFSPSCLVSLDGWTGF